MPLRRVRRVSVAIADAVAGTGDSLTGWLDDVLAGLAAAVADCSTLRHAGEVGDAERIDRIARLERLKAAAAALQVAESVRFAQSQAEQQLAADVHPDRIGRGIADQLGLACHVSGFEAARRLGVARALWFDLPQTFELLTTGAISAYVASLVVTETRHLDAGARRQVDAKVVAAGISTMGVRSAAACARRHAYQADPQGYLQRGRTERQNRRVGLRAAPDTMSVLSGYLPVEHGVACLKSLRAATDKLKADGDRRTRDQIMADTMVERLTGSASAFDVDVEVQIMMPIDSLLDPNDPTPAEVAGYGPLPTGIAREILAGTRGRLWWRRLFTAPPTRHIVSGDPFRRRFDGFLKELITMRDRGCRDPFCDAPIRHLDHIHRHSAGGSTSYSNGRGVCERGNYAREMPGWRIDLLTDGMKVPHAVKITTPTGHSYVSRAPDPP